MLLILDLDETLIHASRQRLNSTWDHLLRVPGGTTYYIYRRPHLEAFLEVCREHYELALWSSATEGYVQEIIGAILPENIEFRFVWSRDRCTLRMDLETRRQVWVKDLKKVKKLGYSLDQILVVDDSPEKLVRQYGNLVAVYPFTGDQHDEWLPRLGTYLVSIREAHNVRKLEKRNWHRSYENPVDRS